MMRLLSTKEVAQFLGVNEKQIYTLVSEKRLPATKITGKWLFPLHLVEQWLENNTLHHPQQPLCTARQEHLVIIAGSNDILLERACGLFARNHSGSLAAFANLGSMGGIQALRRGLCDIACSHLLQGDESDYNFAFANGELEQMPLVMNFCRREQGIVVPKGNPQNLQNVADIHAKGLRLVNRPLGTGTRLLLDHELEKSGLDGRSIPGYAREVLRHLDVGLDILAGRADAGLAIRPVCTMLPLDFVPLRWERFDLLMYKQRFFDKPLQAFLNMLHSAEFLALAEDMPGYDTGESGSIRYPGEGQ